jgi:ABC-type nickel/cobalt efflux system permease component RcnA
MRAFIGALCACLIAVPALAHGAHGIHADAALPFLALGFAVGLAHALDADHVAAVAAMMGQGDDRRGVIARGAAWGLGHTLALFVICSVVLLLGLTISGTLEATLELAVGALIVVLGLRVLWKMQRERIHIHAHEHDGTRHIHAHSHAGDPDRHDASVHGHEHASRVFLPTLGVGLLHGAAGSAGLLVLIVATADSTAEAILAFALFGAGSLIGMTLLTAAASYPLGYIHRGASWMRTSLALGIGGLALFVGGGVVYHSLQSLGLAGL